MLDKIYIGFSNISTETANKTFGLYILINKARIYGRFISM